MTTEEMGRKQTQATKKKIAKGVSGSKNGMYDQGQRSYRKKAGLKDNDGKLVHHKDGNRANNSKSNLEVVPKSKRGEHEKKHDRAKNFQSSGGRKPKSTKAKAKRLKK